MTEDEKTKDQKRFSFQAGAIIGCLGSAYYILSFVALLSGASADPSHVAAIAFASKLSYVLWHV